MLERLGLAAGQLLRRQRAPRGERRLAGAACASWSTCSNALAERYGEPVDRLDPSAHAQAHRCAGSATRDPRVQLHKPFGFLDYVKLQMQRARRAVRQRHDHRGIVDPQLPRAQHARGARAAGRHGGSGGDDGRARRRARHCEACASWKPSRAATNGRCAWCSDYEPANVSDKVLRIILSYTDYVNRRVWKK